ncbi:hypothetical protein CDAR_454191 [Caerostris darwini]|uniref:Uncharacterized protein n=1 Tax=Caerostris darwini TaxID=1538125 RepID=A0AAV4V7R4_9ARAC|nr:hypothetical protein CDAR_454191 [Caerostris darwini]
MDRRGFRDGGEGRGQQTLSQLNRSFIRLIPDPNGSRRHSAVVKAPISEIWRDTPQAEPLVPSANLKGCRCRSRRSFSMGCQKTWGDLRMTNKNFKTLISLKARNGSESF